MHNYQNMTDPELADELSGLVGNTALLAEAASRLRIQPFLTELDGMVESTEEFILDDTSGDTPKEVLDQLVRNNKAGVADRMKDLLALEHVRELYTDAFQTRED